MEKTLVMVKPDGVELKLVGLVVSEIEYTDLKISRMTCKTLSKTEAEALYAEHKGKDFFARNIEHITSGPAVIIEVAGDEAVPKCREIVEEFRRRYVNVIELPKNIAHATSDPTKASEELDAVFQIFS